jgi:hypothetical protein
MSIIGLAEGAAVKSNPAAAAIAFAFKHWRLILSSLGFLILGLMLAHAKQEARHWHGQSDRFEALYHSEQLAHQATIANYRAAAKQAEAEDAANKARVEHVQTRISKEVSNDYQAKLAALRARYDAIRVRSGASAGDLGSSGDQGLPGTSEAASGPDAAGPIDPFACEANTLQLTELASLGSAAIGCRLLG